MKRFIAGLAVLSVLAGCGGHKKKVLAASQRSQLAATKLNEGDAEGALADLSEAHKLDPGNADITHLFGMAYWAKGRLIGDEGLKLKAETYVLESFKQKGKDVPGDWHNNLGALYIDMKKYGDAVVQLEIAIQDPEYRTPERPKNNLSEAFFQQREYAKALQYANDALRIQPRFCMANINKAKAADALKKNDDAIAACLRAIEDCPEYPEPHLRLGLLYMKTGKKADARNEWQKAKKLDPDGPVGKEADGYLRQMGK